MKQLLVPIILALSLNACTNYFGLSKEEWERLTPAQQSQIIKAYNQREAERQQSENERAMIAEQNAPINNLISVLSNAIPNKEKSKNTTSSTTNCNLSQTKCITKTTSKSVSWGIGN